MDRRKALTLLVQGSGVVVAGVAGVPPLITALSPALQGRPGESWQPVGRLDDFALGTVTPARVEIPADDWARALPARAVYVWRLGAQEIVVWSRNCTDLSCPIIWDPGSECFFCPCHGGIFAKNGEPMAGPPKQPLYRYANRVRDGVIEIDLHSLPPMT